MDSPISKFIKRHSLKLAGLSYFSTALFASFFIEGLMFACFIILLVCMSTLLMLSVRHSLEERFYKRLNLLNERASNGSLPAEHGGKVDE